MADPAPKLRTLDAGMIHGLPDPGSPESLDWIRDALAALQARQGGPDMGWLSDVLAEMQRRLDALEARPEPLPIDLSAILARLDALEAREIPAPAGPVDPLDPLFWEDLASAQAALTVLVTREAARKSGHSVELYEEMVELDAKGEARSPDEELRLLQHQSWALERQKVELARLEHLRTIRTLPTLAAAVGYDWRIGWPSVGAGDAGSGDEASAANGV